MNEASAERNEQTTTWKTGARLLGRAVLTLFLQPPHHRVYRELVKPPFEAPQSMQPSLENILKEVHETILPKRAKTVGEPMSDADLLVTAAILMQFGDHLHDVPEQFHLSYDDVWGFRDSMIERFKTTQQPLTMADQLDMALERCEGDVGESLRLLHITTRHATRLLDSDLLTDAPDPRDITDTHREELMREWQRCLAAFKGSTTTPSDAGGDNYYAWTHAYAAYAFDALADKPSARTQFAASVFQRGGSIMQTLIANCDPRGLVSDHSRAWPYGNQLGEALCAYAHNSLPDPRR